MLHRDSLPAHHSPRSTSLLRMQTPVGDFPVIVRHHRLWVFLVARGLVLHADGRRSRCVAELMESQGQRRISLTIRYIFPQSHASQARACPNPTLPGGDKQPGVIAVQLCE